MGPPLTAPVATAAGSPPAPSIVSDSAKTLFLRLLLTAVGLGASVLISRGLGPEGRGAYYLPVIAAGTTAAICKLGLEQANVFLYGTQHVAPERLSGQNGLIALAMGGLGALVLVLAPRALPGLFSGTPVALVALVALSIPFILHTQFSAVLLTLRARITWQFSAALLAGLVQITLLATFWISGRFTVGAVLVTYVVTVLLTWLLTVSAFDARELRIQWDGVLLRLTLRHSLLLHLGMVLFFLHLRLDQFMVKALVGTAALGLYSLAVVLAESVLLPTDSLGLAILPRQVGNTIGEAAQIALDGARANALVGLGLATGWAVAGAPLIRIFFGEAFLPAYLPLLGLLPGMVFLGMQRVCSGPILRAGRPGRFMLVYAVSLTGNIILNLWWIPSLGLLGAALASSVTYGLSAMLFLVWTARLAGAPWGSIIPRRADWRRVQQAAREGIRFLHSLPLRNQAP